jgi:hypothetical protein
MMLVIRLRHFPPDPRAEEIVFTLPDGREITLLMLEPPYGGRYVERAFGIDSPGDVKVSRRLVCLKEAAAHEAGAA